MATLKDLASKNSKEANIKDLNQKDKESIKRGILNQSKVGEKTMKVGFIHYQGELKQFKNYNGYNYIIYNPLFNLDKWLFDEGLALYINKKAENIINYFDQHEMGDRYNFPDWVKFRNCRLNLAYVGVQTKHLMIAGW